MIGFKKTPSKLVLSVFFISLIFVLLIYVDSVLNKPIPEEKITISMSLTEDPPVFKNKVSHEVNKGESLSVIFEEKKVPLNTAYKIFNFDEDNILSSIKPGDLMEFNYIGDDLYSIKIIKDDVNSILIDISEDVSIKKIKKQIQKITSLKQGEIKNSFYMDALRVGIPESIIMDFAYIFGWDIDFIFDVREGDKFSVIYETDYSDGEKISTGDIIFAEFINNNQRYIAQRFYDDDQGKQYFNENGMNVKKGFLRAPLDFTRISDHFNPNRKHPILHTIRAHKGTDYAASRGTPIQATGDGVIIFAGVKNGCGNEILIRHANNYQTRYCHMQKFNKGIKKGKKVNQGETIGYVGSTGLATGPHLHYEFMIGNKHTDPVKVKLPSAKPVNRDQIEEFRGLLNLNLQKLNNYNSKENG
tara:strand:- start:1077 stop:2321 length:1245 start_codon:yes stop_codon:yes gene_type:complete